MNSKLRELSARIIPLQAQIEILHELIRRSSGSPIVLALLESLVAERDALQDQYFALLPSEINYERTAT